MDRVRYAGERERAPVTRSTVQVRFARIHMELPSETTTFLRTARPSSDARLSADTYPFDTAYQVHTRHGISAVCGGLFWRRQTQNTRAHTLRLCPSQNLFPRHLAADSELSDPLLAILYILHACRAAVLDQDLSKETSNIIVVPRQT